MRLPERSRRYESAHYDSGRWSSIDLRPGDIVVATPNKAGTTWTQYLCAMALHGGPNLPAPLSELSVWTDTKFYELAEVVALYERQSWRRVFKTHTPLDGLPYREDVSYVVCGRDARDAFLSMCDHNANFTPENKDRFLPLPADVDLLFRLWMTGPSYPWTEDGFPYGPYFHHLASFWEFRHLPNVHFLHYQELTHDLPRAFDQLAAFLRVDDLSAEQRESILDAARFEVMRKDADALAPFANLNAWISNQAFFRAARSGAWREALNAKSHALYEQLTRERYPRDLLHWIEHGRVTT